VQGCRERLARDPKHASGAFVETTEQLDAALANRYAIARELGRGGMATVYLAHDLRHDRLVALKVLRPDLAAGLGPERFLREIRTTAQLTHPHILPLLDSGQAAGMLFYVMPYVEGESLQARLAREKQIPLDDALQIAREVAEALWYAHSHGVIHRDIKPGNILLESGHAVVADFGIARAVGVAGGARLTDTGLAVGTPEYMSPEQAAGDTALDGRSDQYSLACVLYEMLAGEPPFTGATAESVVHQHLAAEAPSVGDVRPAVPAHVAGTQSRALAKAPADRFATTLQFADGLRSGMKPVGAPAAVRERRLAPRFVASAAALLILIIGGWLGTRLLAPGSPSARSPSRRPFTIVAELDGNAPAEIRAAARHLIMSALDQSGLLATLPEDQVKLGLALAGKPAAPRLDVPTARELAVRGTVRTVVTGTIDQVGQTYHAAVRVLDADSDVVVAAERGVARGADDLILTLDRVVRALCAGLGERHAEIAARRPLRQVATPSFAAYQLYRRGIELNFAGDYFAALPAYRKALALDPEFAEAWRSLAHTFGNSGFMDSAVFAISQALRRPERLTESQYFDAEAFRAELLGDDSAALAAEEGAYRLDHSWAVNLALKLSSLGRLSEGATVLESLERELPFGLRPLQQGNLAQLLARVGRFDEARRRVATISGDYGTFARMEVAWQTGDWTAADSLARVVLERTRVWFWRSEAFLAQASVRAARGQVRAALATLDQCATRLHSLGCGFHELVLRVATGSPVTGAELGVLSADTTAAGSLLQAWLAAISGDTIRARRLLARVRAMLPARRRRLGVGGVVVDATLAASAGRPDEVVRLLRPLADRGTLSGLRLTEALRWSLAAAYERLGRPDSAAACLDRLVAWQGPWNNDEYMRGLTQAFARQRLVVLYARLGRLDDARRHWKTFRETFTNPDPEMRHFVDEARAAMASAERGRWGTTSAASARPALENMISCRLADVLSF
jgi:serine/threonine protein kinase/tetratricopeptide (TPR) repeat protein